jgi:hypothetical protein
MKGQDCTACIVFDLINWNTHTLPIPSPLSASWYMDQWLWLCTSKKTLSQGVAHVTWVNYRASTLFTLHNNLVLCNKIWSLHPPKQCLHHLTSPMTLLYPAHVNTIFAIYMYMYIGAACVYVCVCLLIYMNSIWSDLFLMQIYSTSACPPHVLILSSTCQ